MRAVVSSKTPPISVRYKDSLKQILKIYLRFNPKDLGGRTRLVIVHALVWTFFFFFFVYICIYRRKAVFMNIKKKKNANYNGVWATSWETPVLEDSRANYNNMLFFFVFFPPEEKIWPPASLSRVAFSPLIEEKEAVGVIKEGSLEVERGIKE